jgi:hypothetical protein
MPVEDKLKVLFDLVQLPGEHGYQPVSISPKNVALVKTISMAFTVSKGNRKMFVSKLIVNESVHSYVDKTDTDTLYGHFLTIKKMTDQKNSAK